MTFTPLKTVLTIAGSDSSGGAGIQADIKAISATGGYGASVITALTAQNFQGVHGIHSIPPKFIRQQLQVVLNNLPVQVIKIGMLFNAQTITTVQETLSEFPDIPVVIDPVAVAQSGSALIKDGALNALENLMHQRAYLITPNLHEAGLLMNKKITHKQAMQDCVKIMAKRYQTHVLIKGGHLQASRSWDLFFNNQSNTSQWFSAPKIETPHTHGTGCSLAAAISSYLAQNHTITDAIDKAKHYISRAIQFGAFHPIIEGYGPIDHFHALRAHKE